MKQIPVAPIRKIGIISAVYFLSVGLTLPSLIRSGYIRVIAKDFLLIASLYYALILLVVTFNEKMSSVWIATASGGLAVGNTAQALMYFACHADDQAAATMERIKLMAIIHIGIVTAVWIVAMFISWLISKHWIIENVISGFICFGSIFLVMFLGDKNSNTSTVSDRQPAILMAFLIIYCFAVSLGRQNPISRFLHWLYCILMIGSLAFLHELGIPILCVLSCVLYYLLIYPTPKWITIKANGIVGSLGIVLISLISNSWKTDTISKLVERPQESSQIRAVVRSLQSSSLFGNWKYSNYVPAASTDFSLANIVSYFGYIYILVISVSFLYGVLKSLIEESNAHGFTITTVLRGLCTVFYLVLNTYNLTMSFRMVPLIGCQALFCGKSLSYAILSGAVLGCITLNEKSCKKMLDKLKALFQRLSEE